jgi:molybdopterin synthase catalytic subunit
MIRVQAGDFDVGAEFDALVSDARGDTGHAVGGDVGHAAGGGDDNAAGGGAAGVGGVALFVGLVRDFADGGAVEAMTLEHYPAMTERQLRAIDDEARRRWPLAATRIVHRYGRLEPGDKIVLVATASAHRDAAFESCRFLIDWLKTRAPFWKAEEGRGNKRWVAAQAGDDAAAARWDEPASPTGRQPQRPQHEEHS